jgi:hypothetical protein
VAALALLTLPAEPAHAQSYRVTVQRLHGPVFQAIESQVVIETRACGDLGLAEQPEPAILNWEGRYGANWLLFTASRIKCDVVGIR